MRGAKWSAAAVVALAAAAPTASAADHSLDSVVLKPAQVGKGYKAYAHGDGGGGRRVKGSVTLDMCGFDFPSEALRTNRLQVDYARGHGTHMVFSNEIVRYSGGGAQQALSEVRNAAAHCPKHQVRSHVRGVPPMKQQITVFDSKLGPDALGLLVHATARDHGARVSAWFTWIYQVRGDLLSGIYTFRGSAGAQRQAALRLAADSARNLNAAAP